MSDGMIIAFGLGIMVGIGMAFVMMVLTEHLED
jgi:capsular polysaccharide biosynthesis protein